MALGDIHLGSIEGRTVTASTGVATDQYVVEGENGFSAGTFDTFEGAKAKSDELARQVEGEEPNVAAQAAFLASRGRDIW